jgi:hypothetical protein
MKEKRARVYCKMSNCRHEKGVTIMDGKRLKLHEML